MSQDRNGFRPIFYLLCWEGAFAAAYDAWLGPTYLSGLAGELRVPVSLVSFLIAVPWIGATGQLLGIWALPRVPSLKAHTLKLAAIARALWVLPLFLALFLAIETSRSGN